jgi:hypothetical protein
MRLKLDPFSPSGVSFVEDRPLARQSTGYVINKATGLITAGTNVTITGNGTTENPYQISSTGGGGGGSGITRSISVISSNTTAGSTAGIDYTYICTGTLTLTLPTAVSNTNRYSVVSTDGKTTVATTGGQTINGSSTATLPLANMTLEFINDNANWHVE